MSRRERIRRGGRYALVALVGLFAVAHAAGDRVAELGRSLAAVHDLGAARRDQLARDLYEAARTRCHGEVALPAPACLADAAVALCRGDPACEAAADVVMANTRAANDWVDEATRARLARGATDYRTALAAELTHRYGALAAELALSGGGSDAASIDRFCRERDAVGHACLTGDALCVPSLPWSRCSAALVWYIGSQP